MKVRVFLIFSPVLFFIHAHPGYIHLSYEGRLRAGVGSMLKRRLWGDLIAVFQYLKGAYKKNEYKLFNRDCSVRTGGNGFELEEGRFRLHVRKKFFQ